MGERYEIDADGSTIAYHVVRSRRRRKTIEITLDPREGVRVAAPWRSSNREIAETVRKRATWILGRLGSTATPTPRKFEAGEQLPYLGRMLTLAVVPGPAGGAVEVEPDLWGLRLRVPRGLAPNQRSEAIEAALTAWYGEQAALHFDKRVAYWASRVGKAPSRVLVRNQRRRWASCASDDTLRFNWRLMLADEATVDYVVVHELAHLLERNHSPAFWAQVERVLPDYAERRRHLREVGATLAI